MSLDAEGEKKIPVTRRDDPEILKMIGLTEEDIQAPRKAVALGGLTKLRGLRSFMAMPTVLDERGYTGHGRDARATPMWQSITGLFPDQEKTMGAEQRQEALRDLIDTVMALLRFEMEEEKKSVSRYHTMQWDPLATICFELGISRAHLSRLSKEVCGLAAHELVDMIRVKGVKERMKEEVRKYLAALKPHPRPLPVSQGGENGGGGASRAATGRGAPSTAVEIWRALRAARTGPTFHRGTYALGFGFPNYMRFYRACLVFYQMAPQQVEFMAIEEVLNEMKKEKGKIKKESDGELAEVAERELEPAEIFMNVAWEDVKRRHVQFFTAVAG